MTSLPYTCCHNGVLNLRCVCVCWKFHILGEITPPCILYVCVELVARLVTQCNNATSCSVFYFSVVVYILRFIQSCAQCESATAPFGRSSGCFCRSRRSLGTGVWWPQCKELVDLVVGFSNLGDLLRSARALLLLDVGLCWYRLDQSDLFLGCQVLYLNGQ